MTLFLRVLLTIQDKEGEHTRLQTIIDGFRIYYNFIRPHQSLNGKTPAQEANIDLKLGKCSIVKALSEPSP